MSITAALAAARRELSIFKTATCEVRTAAASWVADPSARVACHYEQTPPERGERLDFEVGNGYGYTVWFDEDTTIAEGDVVVIISSPVARDVGMELQVQQIPPRSNAGLLDKVDTVKRA